MDPFVTFLRSVLVAVAVGPAAVRRWRWLLATLVVVVSWLALSPAPPEAVNTGWDKLNHASAFAALTVASIWAFPRARGSLLLLGALLCFGGLIEIAQSFTPTRSAEWADLLADAVGMAAGVVFTLAVALLTRAGARSE